jgi:hypothetical protein
MINLHSEDLESTLDRVVKEFETSGRYPFPTRDCSKILANRKEYENFIPHLDLFFLDIAGYYSQGKNILKWPNEKTERVISEMQNTFFEKYKEYRDLQSLITAESCPDLFQILSVYESFRKHLVDILEAKLNLEKGK